MIEAKGMVACLPAAGGLPEPLAQFIDAIACMHQYAGGPASGEREGLHPKRQNYKAMVVSVVCFVGVSVANSVLFFWASNR